MAPSLQQMQPEELPLSNVSTAGHVQHQLLQQLSLKRQQVKVVLRQLGLQAEGLEL
jgi:hypothetical protein